MLYRSLLCVCVLGVFSRVRLFVTLQTVARQAPLSMGLSRQEYWSYHFLLWGIFLAKGSNTGLLHSRQTLYHLSHQGGLSLSPLHSFCYKARL